jgi:hypothetical protein
MKTKYLGFIIVDLNVIIQLLHSLNTAEIMGV